MKIATLAELGVTHYGNPLEEAGRCRNDNAIFDFSFMSRVRVTGAAALQCLNRVQSRELSSMQPGDIRYSLVTDAEGIVGADLTVWKIANDCFEIFAGRLQDLEQISAQMPDQTGVENLSDLTSIFSIQGPGSLNLLSRLTDPEKLGALSYFQHGRFDLEGTQCQIGRLGYTGEKGFEIVIDDHSMAARLWDRLATISHPAGVAAIDILRIEAGFILFLNECQLGCNALELGLSQFSGAGQNHCRYQLVGFRVDRQSMEMPWAPPANLMGPEDGEIIITSASLSIICDDTIGLGFVRYPNNFSDTFRDPSGMFHNIKLTNIPFYDPHKKIPRSNWCYSR